ncbi:MAG: tetratricopeptide repeat protein [Candidatus Sulfobium sp.]|jgi:tetratricopeptide (TPR) repeat protein
MGKIVPFPLRQSSKFGFERARKRSRENPDQLNLFSPKPAGVRRLPTNISPFEEALLLEERDDSRAEKLYLRAIAEGDQIADAYCNLGILESRAGRMTKAFDCFTRSLRHDPRHFESHYNLGNLYFDGDNLRLARMHYELASEIEPGFPNLVYNLGLVLALLDEKEAALEAFVKYQRLVPREERWTRDLIGGLRKSLTTPGQGTPS